MVPVRVTPHKSLNTRKGVIRCQDLSGMEEQDIQQELASQNVSHVKRIFIDRGRIATRTYVLTFQAVELPCSIKIGYINARVSVYVPNPLRCFRCQRYGHGSSRCTRDETCSKCAGNHSVNTCSSDSLCCANCTTNNNHTASDKTCPTYIKEKQIMTIKYTENISFPDARKIVEAMTPVSTSYSSALKGNSKVSSSSVAVQTDVTWPDNQSTFSYITQEDSVSTQTDQLQQQSGSSSVPAPSKPVNSRRSGQSSSRTPTHTPVNQKGESGRGGKSQKDSHIKNKNKFSVLESMDTEDVHVPPDLSRSRSRSPIKAP